MGDREEREEIERREREEIERRERKERERGERDLEVWYIALAF